MADTDKPSSRRKTFTEYGESGVQIFSGIITGEEYNYDLMGRRGLQTYDRMRKSDASVKQSLSAIKLPIKSLSWFVTPASDDPKDIEVADFVNYAIFDILRWRTALGEILTHLEFGFSVHEKVWTYAEVDGKPRIVLKKLAFRKQTSIEKWVQQDGKPGVTQVGSEGKPLSIPLDSLVVFTNEQEGDNYQGTSILRAAYKHYFYVDKFYQIDAITQERQGLGVVKIKHPKNATRESIESAKQAAMAIRANEKSYIEEPDGFEISFMDMMARTLKEAQPSIDHHVRQISVNVVAQFLNLGSTSGSGSRAVGEPQKDLFEKAVEASADYIADTFNQYVLHQLVDLNFNVTDYPKLEHGPVSKENVPELATAIKTLVEAGALTITDADEDKVRSLLRLPERPDDVTRDAEPAGKKTETTKPKEQLDDAVLNPDDKPKATNADTENHVTLLDRARQLRASIMEKLYGDENRAS